MANPTQDNRPIKLIGPLAKDKLLLQSFSGQEGISIPFHFDLLLLSLDFSIAPRTVIGKDATVRIELPGNRERLINGIVTSFTQSDLAEHDFATYQATLAPQLWMLTRNADCRIFQGQTAPQIITEILKENNVLHVSDRLTSDRYERREYCVQYSETDFHFISRLMEEEGIFYFFEHARASEDQFMHTLVLADHPSKFKFVPSLDPRIEENENKEPIADYHAEGSSAPSDGAINSWTVGEEVRPDMYELTDFNFETPTIDLSVVAQTGSDPSLEIYDFPGKYLTKSRGQQLADVRMEEIETAKSVISGSGTYRAFIAGFHFKLNGHFREDFNDKTYLLTSVFHCFKQGNVFHSTRSTASAKYVNTFQCIPHPTKYRPPRTTRTPIIPSTQTAIVVGANIPPNADGTPAPPPPPHTLRDEIYTDKYGRVKVRFHWDRTTALNGDNTCFIRVAHAWAGTGWGHQWIPRIGQEVVVTFLEGDPDRPLITGVVYNGAHPLPFTIPDCKHQSGIRTHGNPFDPDGDKDRWHMLRFDDRMDHEQVFLRSQKRLDVRALGSYFDTCGGDRNTLIGWKDDKGQGGDYNITAGNDHQLHIQGGRYDRVEKALNLTVVGEVVCDFQANQSTLVTNKSELNAKQVIIEASEKISLKVGGSFILIEPSGVTISGPSVKINSGGSGVATVDADIEDPLDASPADTGKPCNRLYTSGSGGGGAARTRTRRTLRSQHAPEIAVAPLPPGVTPCCTITSQTVAISPADRTRRRIGVGEEVDLTVSPGPATWTISGGGTLSPAAGSVGAVRFTAGDRAGSVTITATGAGCTCNITFSVVEPLVWTMKRTSGIRHTAGRPDCGWQGEWYVHPNDVNFYRINFRERDSNAVATGSYTVFNGVIHGSYPAPDFASAWGAIVSHTDADGSKVGMLDTVYSGDPLAGATGSAPPFNVGLMYFPITMQWRVGTGVPRDFPLQAQEHQIFATGRCESRKGGNTEGKMYNDPASTH